MLSPELLSKYNVPVPRYTSYPTAPYWGVIGVNDWKSVVMQDVPKSGADGISIYIHLPFCESLCTYCGCNKKITTNHSVEDAYIEAVHREWAMYRSLLGGKPVLRELHLGGGTPTFFSPANIAKLLLPILDSVQVHERHEFSFEGHPNNTTREHLEGLYVLGFRRVSYGVQDNDPEVQRIINRIQPFENVVKAAATAREMGYRSVNFDLIYGLPRQTEESIRRTIEQTLSVRPDRVAFYSYAHVPWTSKGQRLFDETDLPQGDEKLALYMIGRELFLRHGYKDIGMDHFALPEDELCRAQNEGRLHRNFMGYTTTRSEVLIGLGVSAISSTPSAYVQNDKTLHNYYERINADEMPVVKGCFRTEADQRFAGYIESISCNGYAEFDQLDEEVIKQVTMPALAGMEQDGFVTIQDNRLEVTETGRNFIRNICSAFDLYLQEQRPDAARNVFSRAV